MGNPPTRKQPEKPAVGVLALQGDVREHLRVLHALGAQAMPVRTPTDLDRVNAVVIPGGESTTMGRLAALYGMMEPLAKHIKEGKPVLGTCAGMILLASNISESQQPRLAALDITIERNGYGPQNESFEAMLAVKGWKEPVRGVFIRAPIVESVGAGVEVCAEYGGHPVMLRQGHVLATAFHPELTGDQRIHSLLLEMIGEN